MSGKASCVWVETTLASSGNPYADWVGSSKRCHGNVIIFCRFLLHASTDADGRVLQCSALIRAWHDFLQYKNCMEGV